MNEFLSMVAVVALFGSAWLFWWQLPKWQSRALTRSLNKKDENKKPDELELAKLENENRRTATQLLAGFFVLLSVAFTIYQSIADVSKSERDAKVRASGIELLGKGTTPYERLAGITILREWAKDTKDKEIRQEFLTPLLINFVRARTSTFTPSSDNCGLASDQWAPYLPKKGPGRSVDPDVQGALDYLRNDHPKIEDLNFRALDLTGANLSGLEAKNPVFAFSDMAWVNLSGQN